MASLAQIEANQANAQLSTGPRTEAGKAAVAHNRLTHGLASPGFFILPGEDPEEFLALRAAFHVEYRPVTATELFLVDEMTHARWKLPRIAPMEAAILSGHEVPIAGVFLHAPAADALQKLGRYEAAIRRGWYRAHTALQALRRESARQTAPKQSPVAPPPPADPDPEPICDSNPMPADLARELAAHKARDPLFDPVMDASQMSKRLRRWFERS